jgi:hypothetical protein
MLSDLPYLSEMTKLNHFSGVSESVTFRRKNPRRKLLIFPSYELNAGLGCTPFSDYTITYNHY